MMRDRQAQTPKDDSGRKRRDSTETQNQTELTSDTPGSAGGRSAAGLPLPPDHPQMRAARQASVMRMQQTQGNAAVWRSLERIPRSGWVNRQVPSHTVHDPAAPPGAAATPLNAPSHTAPGSAPQPEIVRLDEFLQRHVRAPRVDPQPWESDDHPTYAVLNGRQVAIRSLVEQLQRDLHLNSISISQIQERIEARIIRDRGPRRQASADSLTFSLVPGGHFDLIGRNWIGDYQIQIGVLHSDPQHHVNRPGWEPALLFQVAINPTAHQLVIAPGAQRTWVAPLAQRTLQLSLFGQGTAGIAANYNYTRPPTIRGSGTAAFAQLQGTLGGQLTLQSWNGEMQIAVQGTVGGTLSIPVGGSDPLTLTLDATVAVSLGFTLP